MLTKALPYRTTLLSFCFVIYSFGILHQFAFETVHVLMHLGDILQSTYTHHHHSANQASDHTHAILVTGDNQESQNDPIQAQQTLEDKIEYCHSDRGPLKYFKVLSESAFTFLQPIYKLYCSNYLRPPRAQ